MVVLKIADHSLVDYNRAGVYSVKMPADVPRFLVHTQLRLLWHLCALFAILFITLNIPASLTHGRNMRADVNVSLRNSPDAPLRSFRNRERELNFRGDERTIVLNSPNQCCVGNGWRILQKLATGIG